MDEINNNTVYGYKIREPYMGELDYFQTNPSVTGMATQDGAIILNPFSNLKNSERKAVLVNEAARLYMRENDIIPDFEITPEQRNQFTNTPYAKDELLLKRTIAARILSGDPSAGEITLEQRRWVEHLQKGLKTHKEIPLMRRGP